MARGRTMMPNPTADPGADEAVMAGEMTGNAAHRSTAQTPGIRRLDRGHAHQRDGTGNQHRNLLHN